MVKCASRLGLLLSLLLVAGVVGWRGASSSAGRTALAAGPGAVAGSIPHGPAALAQTCLVGDGFDNNDLHGWTSANTGAFELRSGGPANSRWFLYAKDGNRASTVNAPATYLGDLIARGEGCGTFCFAVNLLNDGEAGNASLAANFYLYSGANVAQFLATSISEPGGANPGWHTICAPLRLAAGGTLPASADGQWRVGGQTSGTAAVTAWNAIVRNVTAVQFPVDWASSNQNEEVGYDNFCLSAAGCATPTPSNGPTPAITGVIRTQRGCTEDPRAVAYRQGETVPIALRIDGVRQATVRVMYQWPAGSQERQIDGGLINGAREYTVSPPLVIPADAALGGRRVSLQVLQTDLSYREIARCGFEVTDGGDKTPTPPSATPQSPTPPQITPVITPATPGPITVTPASVTPVTPTASVTPGTPFPPGPGLFLTVCCLPTPDPIPPRLLVRDGLALTQLRDGRYLDKSKVKFTDLPALAPGTHFVVRLDGWPNEPHQLMRWQSSSIDVGPGERRDLGLINIAPVALRTPRAENGPGQDFPDFAFEKRDTPGDRYIVVVRDSVTGEQIWASEPLAATNDHLSLAGLPLSLEPGREYVWDVVISGGGGGVGVGGPQGSLFVGSGPIRLPRPTVKPRLPVFSIAPRTPGPPIEHLAPNLPRSLRAAALRSDAQHLALVGHERLAALAQMGPTDPLGLPLAMNRHTPGILIDYVRQGGIVLSGIYGERPAPIRGPGETGIQVQNLAQSGSVAATITTAFYEQYDPFDPAQLYDSLPPPAYLVKREAVPGAAANIYLPGAGLPFPSSFSALIDGGGTPLAAIYRADWPSTRAAAIYSNVEASDRLVIPLVLRHYRGQDSVVTIQNLSPPGSETRQFANVRLVIYASGRGEVAAERYMSIRRGQSVTLDFGSIHPALQALGEEFSGSMRILADSVVGAQALVAGGAHSVSGFEGVPEERAAETLYVPLFRASQSGLAPGDVLDTGISVVNPGAEAVTAIVTFYPTSDPNPLLSTCREQPQYVQRATVAAHSSVIFYQGSGGRAGIEPAMPAPCYGSAVIRSVGGGILAIVQDGQNGTQLLSAYNAVPASQTARKVAVPLWRNDHSAYRLTTGIQVMNTGNKVARRVAISFRTTELDGSSRPLACGAPCQADIAPGAAHTFWPGDTRLGIPRGTYGAALIESPEPIAVVVVDFPLTGAVDAAAYNGIPMQ